MASRRSSNWIRDLVDERALEEAREEALALQQLRLMARQGAGGVMTTETGLSANLPEIFSPRDEAALPAKMYDAGYDPAAFALAQKRMTEESDAALRAEVVRDVLRDPSTDRLLATDIAQNKSVRDDGQLVRVGSPQGDMYYRQVRRGVTGDFDYVPATDPADKPLRIPRSERDTRTTLQKDTAFIQQTLGVDEDEALRIKLSLKDKSPQAAWAALVQSVSTSQYGRFSRDANKLRAQAELIWGVARPGEPVPATPLVPTEPAATPGQPGQVLPTQTVTTPAATPGQPGRGGQYATPDAVRAAYRAKQISREEAVRLLRGMGFE